MELRDHIYGVAFRKRADTANWAPPEETVWTFEISDTLYQIVRQRMITECERLYNKYTGNGTVQWSCPALGEYDEDFAWVFFGEQDIPLNLYESKRGGLLEIVLNNRPDDELDRLDPNHPDWFQPHQTQWLEALTAFKQLIEHV